MDGKNLGIEIRHVLMKDLGEMGNRILNEQCQELDIRPEHIKASDLAFISQRMVRALRPLVGNEKAQKVGKDINKIKLILELKAVQKNRDDPGFDKRMLDIHSRIANLCYSVSDWDEAFEHYDKVRRLSKKLGDELKLSEAYRGIGHIHVSRSDWEEAIKFFEMSYELSEKNNQPLGMADAERGIGYVHWRISEYEKAFEYLEKAMEYAINSEDKRNTGLVHIEFGLVYSEVGNMDKSLSYFTSSLKYFNEIMDYEQVARAYNNIGDTYMAKKEWEKALEYLDLCREAAEKLNHKQFIAWSKFNSGECLCNLGRTDDAIPMLEEALELLNSIDDIMGISYVYRNLGLAHRLKKNWDEAEKYFIESEKISEILKSPFNSAILCLDWGLMKRDKGNKKEAKKLLTKARDIFKEINAEHLLEQAEKELAKIS